MLYVNIDRCAVVPVIEQSSPAAAGWKQEKSKGKQWLSTKQSYELRLLKANADPDSTFRKICDIALDFPEYDNIYDYYLFIWKNVWILIY